MVQNALAVGNTDSSSPTSVGGTSADTAPTITISLNTTNAVDVWRIDRATGNPVEEQITTNADGNLQFSDSLPGGMADLFYVVPPAGLPTIS